MLGSNKRNGLEGRTERGERGRRLLSVGGALPPSFMPPPCSGILWVSYIDCPNIEYLYIEALLSSYLLPTTGGKQYILKPVKKRPVLVVLLSTHSNKAKGKYCQEIPSRGTEQLCVNLVSFAQKKTMMVKFVWLCLSYAENEASTVCI